MGVELGNVSNDVKSVVVPYYFNVCLVVLGFLFWILFLRSLAIIIRRCCEYGMERRIVRILSAVFLTTLLMHTAIISLIIFHEIKIHRPFLRNDNIQNTTRLVGSYAILFLNFTIDCLILLSLYTLFAYFFRLHFKKQANKQKCVYILFACIALYFIIVLVAAILVEIVDMHYINLQILSFIHCVPIIINIIISLICIYKLPIMKPLDLAIGLYQKNTKCSCYTPLTRYAWSISTIAIAQAIGTAVYILGFDIWNIDSKTDAKWIDVLTNHDALLIYFASQLFMLVWFWTFVQITRKQSTDFYVILGAFRPQRTSLSTLKIKDVNTAKDNPAAVTMNDQVQIFAPKQNRPYEMLHVADFSPMDDGMSSPDDPYGTDIVLETSGDAVSPETVATDQAQHAEEDRVSIELVQAAELNAVLSSSDTEKSEHFEDIEAKMEVLNTDIVGEMVQNLDESEDDEEEVPPPPMPPSSPDDEDGAGATTEEQDIEDMKDEDMKMEVVDTGQADGETEVDGEDEEEEEEEEDAPEPPPPPTPEAHEHGSDSVDMILGRMQTPEAPPNVEEELVPDAPSAPDEEVVNEEEEEELKEDKEDDMMSDAVDEKHALSISVMEMHALSEAKTVTTFTSDNDANDNGAEAEEVVNEKEEEELKEDKGDDMMIDALSAKPSISVMEIHALSTFTTDNDANDNDAETEEKQNEEENKRRQEEELRIKKKLEQEERKNKLVDERWLFPLFKDAQLSDITGSEDSSKCDKNIFVEHYIHKKKVKPEIVERIWYSIDKKKKGFITLRQFFSFTTNFTMEHMRKLLPEFCPPPEHILRSKKAAAERKKMAQQKEEEDRKKNAEKATKEKQELKEDKGDDMMSGALSEKVSIYDMEMHALSETKTVTTFTTDNDANDNDAEAEEVVNDKEDEELKEDKGDDMMSDALSEKPSISVMENTVTSDANDNDTGTEEVKQEEIATMNSNDEDDTNDNIEGNDVDDDKAEDNMDDIDENDAPANVAQIEQVEQETIVRGSSEDEDDKKTDEEDMEEIEREILEPIEHTEPVDNVEKEEKEKDNEENIAQEETVRTEAVDSVKSMDTLEAQVQSSADGTEVVDYSDKSESDDNDDSDSGSNDNNDDTNNKPPPNVILEF